MGSECGTDHPEALGSQRNHIMIAYNSYDPALAAAAFTAFSTALIVARNRKARNATGRVLAEGETKTADFLCESNLRVRGFILFGNPKDTRLVLCPNRLLLCSPDEKQLVIDLAKTEIGTVTATNGPLGNNPGIEIECRKAGKTTRLKLKAIESVGAALGKSAEVEKPRDAFLAQLLAWLGREPADKPRA